MEDFILGFIHDLLLERRCCRCCVELGLYMVSSSCA